MRAVVTKGFVYVLANCMLRENVLLDDDVTYP